MEVGSGCGSWRCELEMGAGGGSWRGSRVRYCRSLSENLDAMWELESICRELESIGENQK